LTSEKELYAKFDKHPLAWGLYYCGSHFKSSSPRFHLEILKEALCNRFLAIAAPRESAKSTILSFILPTHGILFSKYNFIVICQNTYAKAARSLENIKKELRENEDLSRDFPVVVVKDAEGDSIFRIGTHETRVLCKGAEQIGSVRGEKFGAHRPDLIIIDDLEDDELVKSMERRSDLKDTIDNALLPAGEANVCKVLVIGTILHDDSCMAKFVSKDYYPEFKKLFYRALGNTNGVETSLWNEKWTVDDLKRLQKEKPSVFAKEYQNDPASGLNAKFQKSDIRYWRIDNLQYVLFDAEGGIVSRGSLSNCKAAIACDLAWEEKRDSDYSVVMPAYLTPNAELLVEDYVFKKGLRPDEIEEILFSMEARLRSITGSAVPIGFEKAKLEKVVKWFLQGAMRRRNRFLLLKDLQWDGDKILRMVTRLSPRYTQHVIFHKQGMGDLEYQLLRIPSGTHDDLPDALQGIVQLLEYPKHAKKPVESTTEFDWWRKKAIKAKEPPRKTKYMFGKKAHPFTMIPSQEAFR
jgi:hypothetical protein